MRLEQHRLERDVKGGIFWIPRAYDLHMFFVARIFFPHAYDLHEAVLKNSEFVATVPHSGL